MNDSNKKISNKRSLIEQYYRYNLKMLNEQIKNRGDIKKLNISSIMVESFEKSNKEITQIPSLKLYHIKERILESFIEGKLKKKR